MTLVQKEPKYIKIWSTDAKKVYYGSNQVRPVLPITTAWIYRNPKDWIISMSSDWSTRYTIADKNLWATEVYNNWDTLSQANCWNFYQRWNNYWFPFTWAVNKSSTKVSASWYWPWNYFSSDTFIMVSWTWDSSNNYNLRWYNGSVTNRQWPCPTWFHIPTQWEWQNILNVWTSLWRWSSSSWNWVKTYLKMPFAWYLAYNSWTQNNTWYSIGYWTSVWHKNNYSYSCSISSNWFTYNNSAYAAWWFNIRPFKNEAVQPYSNWTVLYQPS